MSKKHRIDCFVSKEIKDIIKEKADYYGLSIGGYISMLVRQKEGLKNLKEEKVIER